MAIGKQYSYRGVLHTKSSFIQDYTLPRRSDFEIENTIKQLEMKEQQAYNTIFPGCSDFENFINKLRELFSGEYENDAKAFSNFANCTLRQIISKYKRGKTAQVYENYNFKINMDSKLVSESFKKALSSLSSKGTGGSWTVTSTGDDYLFSVGINDLSGLKDLFNKAFSKHYHTNKKNDASDAAIKSFFNEYASQIISFEPNSPQTLFFEAKMPWNYQASDLRGANKNLVLKNQILQAKSEIKNLVEKDILNPCSQAMLKAFEDTWRTNIDPWLNEPDKEEYIGIALFMKGESETSLVGGFGEFQVALLNNYILYRTSDNSQIGPQLKSFISYSLQKGEQSRRDVTILKDIGIQVKNYNKFSSKSILSTTQHPNELSKFPSFPDVQGFQDFLANYFFNLSNQKQKQMDQILDTLPDYFSEIANLDLNNMFSDGVSFYFIEGNLLIPASHIAREVRYNIMFLKDLQITSSYNGHYDTYYSLPSDKPNYLTYWSREEGHGWNPTEQNETEYDNVLSQISVRTNFDYRQLDLKGYRLF